jgi:hypothetical protein
MCVCVCVFHAYTYIIHLSLYVRTGRGYVCVHQCAMGNGSAVCARVGGLVLRARPVSETLSRASACPSAWTACGFGAQAFNSASAFNANIGAWNTARVTTLYQVCAAPGPAALTMADALGRASVRRGPLCAAAPPMRARAHTCRHSLARGHGCRYGRAEGIFGTCIRIYDIYVCVCVIRSCIH